MGTKRCIPLGVGEANDGSTEPGVGASTELFGDETTNQDSLEPEVGELDSLLEDWGVPIRNSGVVAEAVVTDLNRHHTKLLSIKGYRNACIYPSIIKKLLSQKTTSI